jgi:MFS family permease
MTETGPSVTSRGLHYAWIVLAVGTLVVFGSLGLARFGYTMLLPEMKTSLAMDDTRAGALATANLIGYLALAVVGGVLASRYGPRAVITIGLVVAGLGMLLTGLAGSLGTAMAWRALTGIGSGASNVPVMALLSAWFVQRRRGLAAGIGVTGSSLALIVSGWFVPRLLAAYGENGWRVCWFIFAAVTLGLAVLSWAVLRNRPSDVGLQPSGATVLAQPSASAEGGLHWGKVYWSGMVWHVGLVYVAFGFSYMIYMTFFREHLRVEGGYTKEAAGSLLMLMGWVSLPCGLISGWISDVIGRKGALVIVYLIHTAAFALFALWPSPAGFTISAVLFGLAPWSIPAIMAALCGDLLGPRLAPAGLGFITLFFGIGQAAGPIAAGALGDATKSLSSGFLLAAGVALMGAVGSLLLRRAGRSQAEGETVSTAIPDC